MKKRIAIALCLALLLSMVPVLALPEVASAAPDTPAPLAAITIKGGSAVATGGDGYTYDAGTGTLTLTNFTDTTNGMEWNDGYLNIVLEGECVVPYIYGTGDSGVLSFSGDGSLTLSDGIMAEKDLIVDGPTISATRDDLDAIYLKGGLTLRSGNISGTTSVAGKAGIYMEGKLVVEGGTIKGENTTTTSANGTTGIDVLGGVEMTDGTLTGIASTASDGSFGLVSYGGIVIVGAAGKTPEAYLTGADAMLAYDTDVTITGAEVTAKSGGRGNGIGAKTSQSPIAR
ncbi:hypothetical protein LJC20_02645 [Eubacteriales bacterium OttesenSCG-928-M02]|nr:hypothetical protein [Eubacteriales bacterium OttesenSCG-928-M02]